MFFPTSMTSLMVSFRTFSFHYFLADLLQKSISVASNLFCCVFSVHVSAPYSKILWTKAWYMSFWFCEGYFCSTRQSLTCQSLFFPRLFFSLFLRWLHRWLYYKLTYY
jgi:hypothetical protein